ncbi:hypothetical protein KSP39_PZI017467 [Platanthera zijinensis]|uniref:Uncharacterized protein n=1 Tax=Platanthera zijinensis TaxID=2320716 RepID=A0AAP0G018_9ASPA
MRKVVEARDRTLDLLDKELFGESLSPTELHLPHCLWWDVEMGWGDWAAALMLPTSSRLTSGWAASIWQICTVQKIQTSIHQSAEYDFVKISARSKAVTRRSWSRSYQEVEPEVLQDLYAAGSLKIER